MKTIVGFLSRQHGFNVLTSLGKINQYKFLKIYTHKLNPRSQDLNKGIRKDYQMFVNECKKLSIPLEVIDSKNEEIKKCPECDYPGRRMISASNFKVNGYSEKNGYSSKNA